MSTYTPLDHWCTATPANPSIVPVSEPKSYDQFYILFHVRFTYPFSDYDSDEDFCDNLEDTTLSKEFWIPCDQLICDNNNTSLSVISNMLSVLRVPLHVQPFMIQFIGRCAESMVKDNVGGRKVLPMIVSIDVMGRLEDEDGTVVDEEATTVRAIESLVKALEKVRVEDLGRCMICLEKFSIGSDATRMPCSHVFHGDCIVRWLGANNFCPLCPF